MSDRAVDGSPRVFGVLGWLVLAVALVALVGFAAAAPTADAAKRPVVSPKKGDVVRSHRVAIRVRASNRYSALVAKLNGVDVSRQFGAARRGVRTLRASASHGLKPGRNVLRVRVYSRQRGTRRARVRFSVRRGRRMVGAGLNRRVAVGGKARVSGALVHADRSKLRWQVVRAPGSKAARNAVTGRARADSPLVSPLGRTARLRPRTAGRYVLKLAQGRGKRAIEDRVTIDAVPPNPLVPIDTGDDKQMTIGDSTYPLSQVPNHVFVVVLDRRTLQFKSRADYPPERFDLLQSDLAALDKKSLVIVNSPYTETLNSLAIEALKGIGMPQLPQQGTERFAAIGVPGFKPGSATHSIAAEGNPDPGRLTGYLTPDQYLNYRFASPQKEEFSLGAAKALDCPSQCGVKAGYRLSIRDPYTYAVENTTFDFETGGAGADQWATGLAKALESAADGSVIQLQSYSTIPGGDSTYAPAVAGVPKALMARLAKAVAAAGGTRNGFNRTATVRGKAESMGHVYQLVGWAGAGEGEGAESAAGVSGAGDVPLLSGVLRPGVDSQLRPAEEALSDDPTNAIADLAMQAPTKSWPLDDNPGARRALSWLGSQDETLGPDPRTAYWTQDLKTEALISKLSAIDYPPDKAKSFTPEEFAAAKSELIKELGCVGKVYAYISYMKKPFDDSGLANWAEIQNIEKAIREDGDPDDGEVTAFWLEFAESLLDLIPVFGPEGKEITHVIEVTAEVTAFGIRTWGAFTSGGEPPGPHTVDANELGGELIAQAMDAEGALEGLEDMIVSDYAKLRELGPHAGCNILDPDCPEQWAYSKADRVTASKNLVLTVRREGYLTLLPLGYRVFSLARERTDQAHIVRPTAPDPANYICRGFEYPWSKYPDLARQSTSLLGELDPIGADNEWDTFVFSRFSRTDTHGSPPSKALLDTLFNTPSPTGNPKEGGLGLYWTDFTAAELSKDVEDRDYWEGSYDSEITRCGWEK